jgi:hypothetical protein
MEERKKAVNAYIESRINSNLIINQSNISSDDMDHIRTLALSVINTRDEIMIGGGFVQAVVANDLNGAVMRADQTAMKALPLLVNVHKFLHISK